MVGWEAAAVMLEAVYTAMCSMLPTVAKERKAPRVVVVSYKRTVCQSSDNKKSPSWESPYSKDRKQRWARRSSNDK